MLHILGKVGFAMVSVSVSYNGVGIPLVFTRDMGLFLCICGTQGKGILLLCSYPHFRLPKQPRREDTHYLEERGMSPPEKLSYHHNLVSCCCCLRIMPITPGLVGSRESLS